MLLSSPLRLLFLSLLLLSAVSAQEPPSTEPGIGAIAGELPAVPVPAVKDQPKGSVAGHVTFSDTHGPGRGCRILLMPVDPRKSQDVGASAQQLMGVAGLDGSFLIPHVVAGEYAVIGLSVGYLSPLDGLWIDPSDDSPGVEDKVRKQLVESHVTIVSVRGGETSTAEVDLSRGAALSGRVLYSDGSPASQTRVQLQKVDEKEDTLRSLANAFQLSTLIEQSLLHQNLMTDDQGHFRLPGIPAGTYRLAVPMILDNVSEMEAMLGSYAGGVLGGNAGKLMIYSGSTLHRKDAKTFDLRAGDSVDSVEITLPTSGLHIVRGVVTSKEGLAVTYANVELVDTADSTITFHAAVRNDGQFRFAAVPEGIYELKATNARLFAQPIDEVMPDSMMPAMQQQQKATRVFADFTQGVIVQRSDLTDLTITLLDAPPTGPSSSPDSKASSKE